MKLTKGALTMLLAQYRAIYKNAFIKGLASAALATAVLASGSASADEVTVAGLDANNVSNGNVTITAAQDNDTLTTPNITVNKGHSLTFAGGTIKASSQNINAFGDVTFTKAVEFTNTKINVGQQASNFKTDASLTLTEGFTLAGTAHFDVRNFKTINAVNEKVVTLNGTSVLDIKYDQLLDGTNGILKKNNGKVKLTLGGGTLNITDVSGGVLKAGDLEFNNSATTGKINGAGVIQSDKIAVESNIENASGVTFSAKDLTVGSEKFDSSKKPLGTKLQASNSINFVAKTGETNYTLQNTTTLKADDTATHEINGTGVTKLTIGENTTGGHKLSVVGGNWVSKVDIVVANGKDAGNKNSLIIDGTTGKADGKVTSLSLDSGKTLDIAGQHAGLDIKNASLTLNGTNLKENKGTITLQEGGVLNIDSETLMEKALKDTNAKVIAEAGKLIIKDGDTLGDLTLDVKSAGGSVEEI